MERAAKRGAPGADRRRQAVLAGHEGDVVTAIALVVDPVPDVRAAALGALVRLGAADDAVMVAALADTDPLVRRRAVSLAARGGRPSRAVIDALVSTLHDVDASVAEAAAFGLGEIGSDCPVAAVTALETMSARHDSPLCREAAVAALGAIGARRSLPAVLARLADTANIRRRAAVALAAFDDPAADDALRRCRDDRDWQVRQVAEELLDASPPGR